MRDDDDIDSAQNDFEESDESKILISTVNRKEHHDDYKELQDVGRNYIVC
jgi:hypothetical protein